VVYTHRYSRYPASLDIGRLLLKRQFNDGVQAVALLILHPQFEPAGGLLALLFVIFRRNARASLSRAAFMAFGGTQPVARDKAETLPYAVAFTLGAILIALSQSIVPSLRIML